MRSDSINIFNIPTGEPFLEHLADRLINDLSFDGVFAPGFCLSDFTILLPTRRAVRGLRHALMDKATTDSLLMPDIKPMADVDETAMFFNMKEAAILDMPPVISALERETFFLSEILDWEKSTQESKSVSGNIVKAISLSADLASFLDQAQTEEVDLSQLNDIDFVASEYALKWQETVNFLSIITNKWPHYKNNNAKVDPSEYRNRLLRLQAKLWRENPPLKPIIAAGSTGSIPATADLLKQVLELPNGMVILPGLDKTMSSKAWASLAEEHAHPQSGLYHLLQRLELSRHQVRGLVQRQNIEGFDNLSARYQFVNMALLPSEHTAQWSCSDMTPNMKQALKGFSLYEAPDMRREAVAIALALREVLETKDKTAVLVTPDRYLARRVVAELKRWNIDINDTAGISLGDDQVGVLIRLVLEAVSREFAPIAFLSVLKHAYVCLQGDRGAHLKRVHLLEHALLRGGRGARNLEGYAKQLKQISQNDDTHNDALDKRPDYDDLARLLEKVEHVFAPLLELGKKAKARDIAKALLFVLQHLMDHELGAGGHATHDAEEEAFSLLEALMQIDGPLVPIEEWAGLFNHWLAQRQTRPNRALHPRLSIMGLLEARLVNADVMILGGLNEGVWPHLPDTGPWVSRPMRARLGMTSPERRIGLMAHDFVQAACNSHVLLTRSKKTGGTPMVASRWLTRMQALLKGLEGEACELPIAQRLAVLGAQLDPVAGGEAVLKPSSKPSPKPPVNVRPKRLSVTRIEKLRCNPYAIYAQYILGLKKLDLPDAQASGAARGILIHKILEKFVTATKDGLPENSAALISELVAHYVQEIPGGIGVMSYWDARVQALSQWLIGFEKTRRRRVKEIFVEVKGTRKFDGLGRDFTLSGVADRIELLDDNTLSLLDYKTYVPPKQGDVLTQKSPQLLLECLIENHGGFEGVPQGIVSSIAHLHVSGGFPEGALYEVNDFETAVEAAEQGLVNLIKRFNKADTPYEPHTQASLMMFADDYDHLARVAEWSSQDEEKT